MKQCPVCQDGFSCEVMGIVNVIYNNLAIEYICLYYLCNKNHCKHVTEFQQKRNSIEKMIAYRKKGG